MLSNVIFNSVLIVLPIMRTVYDFKETVFTIATVLMTYKYSLY